MKNALALLQKFQPRTGLVLGSGLGKIVDRLEVVARLTYAHAGLPQSRVSGHAGEIIIGRLGGVTLAVLSGRVHLYEGWSAADVTAGVRLLAGLGVNRLILTNAAGTLNPAFPPGEWMMLDDHLNLTGQSPLTGGPHFVDMSETYSSRLREKFAETAAGQGIPLHRGVYAGLCGPQYETPAEIRMLRTMGADAVGMSTVLESIQAHALDMELAAFCCLTNWAAGIAGPLDHSEVLATGTVAAGSFIGLLEHYLTGD